MSSMRVAEGRSWLPCPLYTAFRILDGTVLDAWPFRFRSRRCSSFRRSSST